MHFAVIVSPVWGGKRQAGFSMQPIPLDFGMLLWCFSHPLLWSLAIWWNEICLCEVWMVLAWLFWLHNYTLFKVGLSPLMNWAIAIVDLPVATTHAVQDSFCNASALMGFSANWLFLWFFVNSWHFSEELNFYWGTWLDHSSSTFNTQGPVVVS